jgi:hypothetical protein
MTDAMNTASGVVSGTGGNTDIGNRYFATRQTLVDGRGFPSGIDWTAVACVDSQGATVAACETDTGEYRVQFVIERMCSASPNLGDLGDLRKNCEYEAGTDTAVSSIAIRYRIITRVRGPRGTESWFEAMFCGPASIN